MTTATSMPAASAPPGPAPALRGRLLMVGNFLNASIKTRTAAEELADYLRGGGWTIISTSTRLNKIARMADMLWTTWKRRHDYDVAKISVFSFQAFRWAEATSTLLGWLGKPYVLALHGGNLPNFAKDNPGRVRRLFAGAKAIVAPSAYLQEQLRHVRPDIGVIPNPVPLDQYRFEPRRNLRPRLVWLRAFHKIYNPAMAVRMVEFLARRVPEFELVMVGREKDGSLAATRKLIEEKRLERYITIVPGIPKAEVPARLSASDIFINTSSIDNTPVSVIEAMACGLCVVSTNPGGIPYMLTDGRDSLLVPVENPEAMAAAVERLLADPDLAERLSRGGRRTVEPFDVPQVVEKWGALLDLVNREGGPRS